MKGPRPLPLPDSETAFFWEGCARGELRILRCKACRRWIHYPKPRCPACGSADLAPERTSGRGTVYSFTVTHQAVPGYEPPFAVVLVELEEQRGLRLVTSLVDTPPDEVRIGTPVEVEFRAVEENVVLPMFRRRA